MFTVAKRDVQTQQKRGKEAIHSGHFMVSHFEAEEQDDEYELAVPIPEPDINAYQSCQQGMAIPNTTISQKAFTQQPLTIDTSLSKLFQCMSIAYRQKLTSPKWNRFRGIRLRWKDKIRLNNVIWRCWHMQFIKKIDTDICQFASPLDVDTHNKPEAIVLEGKYWKRKLAAVTAEYKKWRMFHRQHILGHTRDLTETLGDLDTYISQSSDSMHMMVDEDYLGLMSDTLFSSITSQPFVFPDSREIARAGLADFIQPSLGPLQPNLDDYMDTFEPLHEFITGKLPTVPEENGSDWSKQQSISWGYTDLDLINTNTTVQVSTLSNTPPVMDQYNSMQSLPMNKQLSIQETGSEIANYSNEMLHPVEVFLPRSQPQEQSTPQTSLYQSPLISKVSKSSKKVDQASVSQLEMYSKSTDAIYSSYSLTDMCTTENRMQLPIQSQTFKQPTEQTQPVSQGYKFPTSTALPSDIKFTSQSSSSYKSQPRSHMSSQLSSSMPSSVNSTFQQEIKQENRIRSASRGTRQRSISTSREPIKRPPLISAVSDPSLVTPANSVLLTQLLTNNAQQNTMFSHSQSLGTLGPASELSSASVRIKEENLPMSQIGSQSSQNATTLIITTPVKMNSQSSMNDPLLLTSLGTSNSSSPSSSHGVSSCPTSPQGVLGSPTQDSCYKAQRRVGHIHAEQKRRYNIKSGFDVIHSLIPHLNQNPNAKLSKAAMLQKGAEYIRQLQQERSQLKEEMDGLRQQIETLNTSISNCQSLLPATGAPVSRRRDTKMQEMFDEYVKKRTMEDWKFWIFSLFIRPLLASFNNFVSTSSLDDLYRSTLLWVEQHCTLVDLRPVVLNSLRYLCTKTDILSEPEKLPEEAREAVMILPSSSSQTQL